MADVELSPGERVALRRDVGRVVFAFSSRLGGVSKPPYASLNLGHHVGDRDADVAENRRRLLAELGTEAWPLIEAEQVHGAEARVVTSEWVARSPGRRVVPGADALVTREPGIVLSLYFADCVPVFLADADGKTVGLAHAGWRGTARGVVRCVVATMRRELGVPVGALVALIGPCIGPCCYEVGEEVVDAVLGTLPGRTQPGELARPAPAAGKWLLDLARANALQLQAAGLSAEAIHITKGCTCCERSSFFSVRGDGPPTGRCGASVCIRP